MGEIGLFRGGIKNQQGCVCHVVCVVRVLGVVRSVRVLCVCCVRVCWYYSIGMLGFVVTL